MRQAESTILVSGAGGKTGRAVVRTLAAHGLVIRALVRRQEQIPELIALGARDALAGDMRDPHTWKQATEQVQSLYHICPNMSPEEVLIGELALDAARHAGTERFVYHSVLHPQARSMPHHRNKLLVEERIFESRIAFTILQPTAYMQNLLAGWPSITREGTHRVPYATATRISLVDLEDVAEAATTVLVDPGHEGAVYELAGPDAPTQENVAAIVSEVLRRPVRAEAVSHEAWEESARASGLGDYQMQTLLAMFRYYERYGMVGNPRTLGWLLGRPPRSLAEFLLRVTRVAGD